MKTRWLIFVITCAATLVLCCVEATFAQDGWTTEGGFRRWRGLQIITSQFGCDPVLGNPIIEAEGGLAEINLVTGASSIKNKPTDGPWMYIPRNPKMMLRVDHEMGKGALTTLRFFNVWEGGEIGTVTFDANTTALSPDVADCWVADDASVGAVVFAPTAQTPTDSVEYVIVLFDKTGARLVQHIVPKVDLDIYIRPEPEAGVLAYIRGNGLRISGYTDEVFTNASYIYFDLNGALKQLNLPERGPGSGKGRRAIWHSNKWDRMVFSDEYASGMLIVKASNGIPIDTAEHLASAPDVPLRILGASGNNNDRWMVTHAKAGNINALVLWAVPDLKEVDLKQFEASDPATKQLPLSPWSVVIPFLSVSQSGNALYAWDAQDVLSVRETTNINRATASPLPASERLQISVRQLTGNVEYQVFDGMGVQAAGGSGTVVNGVINVDVRSITPGSYTVVLRNNGGITTEGMQQAEVCNIVVVR